MPRHSHESERSISPFSLPRVYSNRSEPYCDGMSRRSFVQLGIAGMANLGLADVLRAKNSPTSTKNENSAILIWLDGGPSHMDLYDLKPAAPRK